MKRNEEYTGFGMGKGAAYVIDGPGELIYCGDNYALWKPMNLTESETRDANAVQLELTPDEADVLAAMLGCVGGNPGRSGRKHTESIADKLEGRGYHWSGSKHHRFTDGNFWFLEKETR